MAKHGISDASKAKEPPYKRPKIRESCSCCSSQKIRCSKERPACSRCVNKGLTCEYNISRRTGTRRQSLQTSPEKSVSPSSCRRRATVALPEKSDTSSPSTSIPPLDYSLLPDDSSWLFNPMQNMFTGSSMPLFHSSTFENIDMPPALVEPNHSFTVEPMSDDELEMLFGLPTVAAAKTTPDTISQWSPTMSAPSQDDNITRNHSQHDHGCLGSALQILSEMHVSSRTCTLSVGSFDEVRELESVLNSNRKALERLAEILECPCCLEQEVLITAYMAISKALSWYSAALQIDRTTDQVDHSTSVGRVVSPPTFMGGYCLDLQAQTLASAHVVMAQLKEHLQPVMVKLQNRADSSPPSRSSSTTSLGSCTMSSGTPSSSEVLECYQRALQDAVSDIVDKVNVIKRG